MRRLPRALILTSLVLFTLVYPLPIRAQEETPQTSQPLLTISTPYPSQVIGIGETITLDINLEVGEKAQIVQLSVEGLPEGWVATFRGGGQVIQSAYVKPGNEASIDLRLEPPANLEPGTLTITVIGRSRVATAELPIELTVKEKLPPRLTFEVELPRLRGNPSTTFRYNVTLKNEGDEDLTVNLVAQSAGFFEVAFKLSGQDVTSVPIGAGESERLSVEAKPFSGVPAGSYPIQVIAQGSEAEATLELLAEVTGQPDLQVTAPDGRLSGQANAGRESPIKVIVRNNGTAPARDIELSSSEPAGWSVRFEPDRIAELAVDQQVEVTAHVRPADKAVAGDYILTVNARPSEGSTKSADFRITVVTSTLWGVVGVALIAVALGVVILAVMRFGRR